MGISSFTSNAMGDKRRLQQYKARMQALPASHRVAVEGIER